MDNHNTPVELIPCPFCGCSAEMSKHGDLFYPVCNECGAEGPAGLSESGAAGRWNTRHGEIPPPAAKTMTHEELYAIIEAHVFATDEWGGSKLAGWEYGFHVCVGGIDEAADAILSAIRDAPPVHEQNK